MKKTISSLLGVIAASALVLMGISTVGSAAGPNQMCVPGPDGQNVCGMPAIIDYQQTQIAQLSAKQAEDHQTMAHLADVTSDLQRAVVELNAAISVDPTSPATEYGDVSDGGEPAEYYACPEGYVMNCHCVKWGFGCEKMVCTCHTNKGIDGFLPRGYLGDPARMT
ncbi:MAG: hypothetical protein IPK82_35045 [Polyangiaceae bacterium]|nr:hypothetical protein [Polyangiaceae bacterium]